MNKMEKEMDLNLFAGIENGMEYVMVFERKEGSYKEMEKYKWDDEYQRGDY
jgi:hypothetical protein